MKTLWSILLICGLWGQNITDTTGTSIYEYDTTYRIGNKIYNSEWVNEIISISLILYEQYKAECLTDTIKAIPFQNDYIINHGTYQEWVSERQLEERGYKYKYRWVLNHDREFTTPLEFEYIFIKKQTLPGFMKWLKEKQ